jgi:hypothetical protein
VAAEVAVVWHKKKYRGFSRLHLCDGKHPAVSFTRCGRLVPDATEYTIWHGEEAWKVAPMLCGTCKPELAASSPSRAPRGGRNG